MVYKCNICNIELDNVRKLNGHKNVHKLGNRYSVSRKKPEYQKTYNCLNCGCIFEHKHSSKNIFCSRQCSTEHKHKIQKEKIKNGKGGNGLKKYLYETRGECCEICGQGNLHNGMPLVLQLDHIDGDSKNNKLENLRILCPNCHTQTDTWGSKGTGNTGKRKSSRNLRSKVQIL